MEIKHLLLIPTLILLTASNLFAQQTIILQPGPEGKDALVNSINPSQNGGESFKFDAMGWTFNGTEGARRSLIDFDLSAIPPGYTILNAKLNLYFYTAEPTYVPHSGDNAGYIRLITSNWEEDQVTWDNLPQTTPEGQVYLPPSTDPEQDYLDIDITGLVRQRYDDPENIFGFMLLLVDESPYRSLMFASGDNDSVAIRPKLVVTCCSVPHAEFQYITNELYVQFSDLSNSASSWWWDFGDGYFSYMKNPSHVYPVYGSYNVCLTITDNCSSSTVCKNLVVSPSGLQENWISMIKIMPNPASDKVSVTVPGRGEYCISLCDRWGRILFERNFQSENGQEIKLDVSSCPQGFYSIILKSDEGLSFSKLVIAR